jgi:hypothetical protein
LWTVAVAAFEQHASPATNPRPAEKGWHGAFLLLITVHECFGNLRRAVLFDRQ